MLYPLAVSPAPMAVLNPLFGMGQGLEVPGEFWEQLDAEVWGTDTGYVWGTD